MKNFADPQKPKAEVDNTLRSEELLVSYKIQIQ